MPPTRRALLLKTSAVIGTAALLPACGDNGGRGAEDSDGGRFRHGVASGDPLSDRVILWTRVTGVADGALVHWRVARDPEMQQIVRMAGDGLDLRAPRRLSAERDYCFKVDVAGLEPGTSYYYDFEVAGSRSPIGRTKTLPTGAVDRVRLALCACSNYSSGWFNAYRALATRDVDAVLHVGDWFYEGASSNSAIGRPHDPPRETVTLEDYRRRHAQYRTDPDLAEAMRQHPFITVWDDHESANNAWIDGAQAHDPETEGDWQLRKRAAARAYAEWMPLRLPDPKDPLTIWRQFAFGDLVDLFMLDTRLQRNAPEIENIYDAAADDPARSMLGADQLQWVRQQMQASQRRGTAWRVLGQQTMMAPHRGFTQGEVPLPYLPEDVARAMGIRQGGGSEGTDNWSAYAAERNALMAFWREQGITNNVVLTGDIHTAWAADVVEDPYTPFNPLTQNLTGVPGYNAFTGAGSTAVEFVAMSVTSSNAIDFSPDNADTMASVVEAYNRLVVETLNPNVMHHNAAIHGFVLVDFTPERVRGEFWQTGPNRQRFGPRDDARFDAAAEAWHGAAGQPGTNHLRSVDHATAPRASVPPVAPRRSGTWVL
ncbi:alkaline phosphatase D family protein [Algiphilus sp.]|uniref:alkaline phosphatase D family protein n=4 Tax=Algiphilus sp. TaxID=1872431 RepID=UPI002A5BA7CE|nr:alkaline phosphatase D family protein [Pseudomonadota bacterium]